MTQIDGLSFTQLDNLNIVGELYEHGAPFGGVTAPLILSTANDETERPLTLRGGATDGASDYDSTNSGLLFNDGNNNEIWRLWASNPNDGGGSGVGNLFLGFNAGGSLSLTAAGFNTGLGFRALQANTNGDKKVAIGAESLLNNVGGSENTAIGLEAMRNNVGGIENVAVGNAALEEVTGNSNTGIGFEAGNAITTGIQNVAIGHVAMLLEETGSNNVAVGDAALFAATGGGQNTALGRAAMFGLTTGSNNIGIGHSVAASLQTGARNTLIGHNVDASSSSVSDEMNICDVLKADLSVGAGAVIIVMDTSESATAGVLWNDNGTVKVSQS